MIFLLKKITINDKLLYWSDTMKTKNVEYGKIYIYKHNNSNKFVVCCITKDGQREDLLLSHKELDKFFSNSLIYDAYSIKIKNEDGTISPNNLGVKLYKQRRENNQIVKYLTKVIFVNYSMYNDYPFFENIKTKVYPLLNKHNSRKSKKIILTGFGKLFVMGCAAGILVTGTKLYKSGIFNDKNVEKKDDSSIIIEDDSSIDELIIIDNEIVLDSTPIQEEDNTLPIDNKEQEYIEKFNMYASYYNFDSNLTSELAAKYKLLIINNDNMDLAIMENLYDYYINNLYGNVIVTPNTQDNDIQSCTIIKYAKMMGVRDPEILYTMLAVHNFETYAWQTQEYGKSDLCVQNNNFGGNIYGDEFQTYPTFEVGAYDFVDDFMRIYNQNYTGVNTIEYDIGSVYCTENMEGNDTPWYVEITNMKNKLKSENKLEYYYDMMNEMDNEKVKSF